MGTEEAEKADKEGKQHEDSGDSKLKTAKDKESTWTKADVKAKALEAESEFEKAAKEYEKAGDEYAKDGDWFSAAGEYQKAADAYKKAADVKELDTVDMKGDKTQKEDIRKIIDELKKKREIYKKGRKDSLAEGVDEKIEDYYKKYPWLKEGDGEKKKD